ncbi:MULTISPECIES: hypothetical protein [Roseicyclus]|uniref:hypothetical protein n=1 Tax=Roseicyclus amphidinii TaxID=3034232 RepID=UPI0024E09BE9|nr:hypothetical protein [Roseicyclus sp. Amp-Y-6]
MSEHQPPAALLMAMTGIFWAVAAASLLFWLGGLLWPGGLSGLMAALGPGAIATLVTLHIPAAIIGILLWQWTRAGLSPRRRVLLEAATAYFILSVILGIFLNYLLVSAMGDVISPVIDSATG